MTSNGDGSQATYAEADWTDFAHTGPAMLAGRYMRLFWQPVYRAEDLLPGQAKPIRIMSEDFTLYRGEGGVPHLLAFRCAHRGTQLPTGWVEGDNLRCFYHGWTYDGSGQCVEQPAEPEPFCQKIKIRSYPVVEYAGAIFAYLGEGAPPAPPRYRELEQEGFVLVGVGTIPCNYFNVIETDAVHNAFAHSRGVPMPIPVVSAEETDWGLAEHATAPTGEVKIKQWGMPNGIHVMESVDTTRRWMGFKHAFHWHVPIDDERTLGIGQAMVPLTGEAARDYRERLAAKAVNRSTEAVPSLVEGILAGRLRVQELYERSDVSFNTLEHAICHMGQGAIADRSEEVLGASDVSVVLYRQIWARELRALAEGRPLKQWAHTDAIVPTEGDMVRRVETASVDPSARLQWTRAEVGV